MNGLIDLAGLAGLVAVVLKIVDFVKLATNLPATLRQVVTQVMVWIVGIGVAWLYAASQYGHGVVVSGVALDTANWATLVLIGIAVGSSASVVVGVIAAVDNTQSAAVPGLRMRRGRVPVPPPAPDPPARPVRRRAPPTR